jgi:hypothetical protein
MAEDFSSMSDVELQKLYWSMALNTDDDFIRNDRIAAELSQCKIGLAQAMEEGLGSQWGMGLIVRDEGESTT